jgi:putative transposase
MDYRTGNVVHALYAHLGSVTEYRRGVLSEPAIRDLRAIFAKVSADFGAELIECNGLDDHVHLLVHYPPKIALSRLVNSRRLRVMRPEVSGRYRNGVLWSPPYFVASCGGAPLSVVRQYVEHQCASARSPIPSRPQGRDSLGDSR